MMPQTTAIKPASYAERDAPPGANPLGYPLGQPKTCSSCPHFDNFHEPNRRGWCNLFDHQAREHHEITDDCIHSSKSLISHELEDNLALFPDVNFEELQAFSTEEIIDEAIAYGNSPAKLSAREARAPHAKYQVGSIVKIIDPDEDYTEWGVFEVTECMHNKNLFDNTETYLHQSEWYYRLSSHIDGNTLPSTNWAMPSSERGISCFTSSISAHSSYAIDKSLWIAENEICDFDLAHNVCDAKLVL